jgi:hypothetical protein
MKRQIKTIIVTAASIAMTVASTIPAQAGHGCSRGGVSRGAYGFQHPYHRYRAPAYMPRTVHPRSVPVHPVQRPVQPQPFPQQTVQQQFQQQPFQQQTVQQQFQQQPIQQQTAQQQFQQQPIQQQTAQPQTGQQPMNSQSLAGSNRVVANRQPTSAPAIQNRTTTQVPAASQRVNSQPVTSRRVNSQPVTSQRVSSQPATPSNANAGNSEASALAMLASISISQPAATQTSAQIPEFTAASSQTAGSHVGNWGVSLPGNQRVELTLNEDGSFAWTASKDGKSNSFQGQFRLENGTLTLVRSNDLQQMKGSWTGEADKFTFKLDGATTSGLAFARS